MRWDRRVAGHRRARDGRAFFQPTGRCNWLSTARRSGACRHITLSPRVRPGAGAGAPRPSGCPTARRTEKSRHFRILARPWCVPCPASSSGASVILIQTIRRPGQTAGGAKRFPLAPRWEVLCGRDDQRNDEDHQCRAGHSRWAAGSATGEMTGVCPIGWSGQQQRDPRQAKPSRRGHRQRRVPRPPRGVSPPVVQGAHSGCFCQQHGSAPGETPVRTFPGQTGQC